MFYDDKTQQNQPTQPLSPFTALLHAAKRYGPDIVVDPGTSPTVYSMQTGELDVKLLSSLDAAIYIAEQARLTGVGKYEAADELFYPQRTPKAVKDILNILD